MTTGAADKSGVRRGALTVVVPCRDRPEQLERCLRSLLDELRADDEIVVVDSASRDDRVAAVARATAVACTAGVAGAAQVRVVRCDLPGVSRARNAGWRAARTELVAFVDDDMAVEPGWADALISAFGARPHKDAAATRVATSEGGTTGGANTRSGVADSASTGSGAADSASTGSGAADSASTGSGTAGAATIGFAVGRVEAPTETPLGLTSTVTTVEPPAVITAGSPGVVSGGNLALPVAVLTRVGGFDERIGPGTWFANGEEIELLDRILATGMTGRYVAHAVTRHEQWRTEGELLRLQWKYGKGMGARVACAVRRDARSGLAMSPELLRLRGVQTALRRFRPSRPTTRSLRADSDTANGPRPIRSSKIIEGSGGTDVNAVEPPNVSAGDVSGGDVSGSDVSGSDVSGSDVSGSDVSGWRGPILWRLGALVGFVAGLARLSPQRPHSSADHGEVRVKRRS